MGKPHKHAALIKAWADGAEIEMQCADGLWVTAKPDWCEDIEYRVKPAMITINGVEVPEPVREYLDEGANYWFVDSSADNPVQHYVWEGDYMDIRWFERGLIHLTREAAEQHARALILASGGSYD